MSNGIRFGVPIIAAVIIGGSTYTVMNCWRHVMPEVVVNVRAAPGGNDNPALLIIYGEQGSDPFRGGYMRADQRISQCKTIASRCVSTAARKELGVITERRQSLQIRLFNGDGNPIVGGVYWTSSWHPRQVRVTCDLGGTDVRNACAVTGVTT